jgi:hypothetical protein
MKNRFKLIAILLLFYSQFVFSDEGKTKTPEVQDILPPTPTAASLGVYGDVGIGMHTGTVQYAIPIYTFKTNHIEVPISLNYASNGIKVDQIASWVGLGWSLSAGGVITRTVRDWPDEYGTHPILDLNSHEFDQELFDYVNNSEFPAYDSESDLYSFNFTGMSGQFIYDHNSSKFFTIPHQGIEIEKIDVGTDFGFKLTTSDGVKYYFEEIEFSRYLGSTSIPDGSNIPTITSWYLTKIEHYSGECVNFVYKPAINYTYRTGVAQNITKNNFTNVCRGEYCCMDYSNIPDAYSNLISASAKSLDYLESPGIGRVDFISSNGSDSRKDIGDYRLDEIKVYNDINLTKPVKHFRLNYENVHALNGFYNYLHGDGGSETYEFYRLFLMSFEEVDNQTFQFNYYNKEQLPPRLSFAQDYWGYFNGENNSSFIPNPQNEEILNKFSGVAFANREPNHYYALNGLLKSVSFPTGGQVNLEYESNKYMKAIYSDISKTPNVYVLEGNDDNEEEILVRQESLSVPRNQDVVFKFTVSFCESDDCDHLTLTGAFGSIEISDASGIIHEEILKIEPRDLIDGLGSFEKNIEFIQFLSDDKTYTVTLNTKGYKMKSYLHFIIEDGDVELIGYEPAETGGFRIKKVENSENSNTKYYYYNEYSNRDKENAEYYADKKYYSYNYNTQCFVTETLPDIGCLYVTCPTISISSSSLLSLFGGGSHIYYNIVTESLGGENFENGGIEHKFENYLDVNCRIIYGSNSATSTNGLSVPQSNTSWNNGNKLKETYFKVKNGVKTNLKVIEYYYEELEKNDVVAYSIKKLYDKCCFPINDPGFIKNYEIFAYDYISRWKPLTSIITRTFDENGINEIVEKEEYLYRDRRHAKPYKTISHSSGGKEEVRITKFPYDYNETTIAGNQFLSALIDEGRIGEKIEEQQWVANKLVSSSRNLYDSNPLNYREVYRLVTQLPKEISMESFPYVGLFPEGLSDADYEKVVKIIYGTKLNINEVIKNGDFPTAYFWAYKDHLPVIKAENANYTELVDAIENNLPVGYSTFDEFLESIIVFYDESGTLNSDIIATWKDFMTKVRTELPSAMLTFYTYNPLIGVTSITEQNGLTHFFSYDDFGRLRLIIDEDNNIINRYTYKYKQILNQ